MFPVNQVFRIGELRKRLLWSGIEQAIWIDIDSDTALPEPISIAELERLLMERELESIADPFEETVLREVEEGSLDQQKRDEAWTMLADFVHDPQLFVRRPRGLIVRGIMERHGVTNQTVYRLLRRYWQRGMCRNALLPDYVNSGARGKRRKPNQAKLGRPRVVMEGKGSNVTPDIERIFRRVIEKRLLKEKHPSIPDCPGRGCQSGQNGYDHEGSGNPDPREQAAGKAPGTPENSIQTGEITAEKASRGDPTAGREAGRLCLPRSQ